MVSKTTLSGQDVTLSMSAGVGRVDRAGYLPGLAALRAWIVYQDRPLVDRPADDQLVTVGTAAERVGLGWITFYVLESRGDQLLYVVLRLAGRTHGTDGFEHEPEGFALAGHGAFLSVFSALSQSPRSRWLLRLLAARLRPLGSGQSTAVMSQKRHSWALGRRTGGSGAAIRRISEPRLRTKPWSMPPWGTRSVRSL